MIDQLIERIDTLKNPTVVGLDPTLSMLPQFIKEDFFEEYGKNLEAVSKMFMEFNRNIIDGICDIVPAVKPQIAMYEKYGSQGILAYIETIKYAKKKGLLVIGDIKRGDIGSTAEAYAGHIAGVTVEGTHFDPWEEDAITVNPYFGTDGIKPFVNACNNYNKSIFVLVKTSNPSSFQLQDLIIAGKDKTIYEEVGDLVFEWGREAMGKNGYSQIGAVVGATHREQGASLRGKMPHTFFLVPGYGAQGGTGEDLKGFFDKNGRGCIVNSSRGITEAYKKSSKFGEKDYKEAARNAAFLMKEDLKKAFER